MMEMEGTLDTVEYTLINLVRGYPELYNGQEARDRDKTRRDLAWGAIARQLNKDEIWCYSKWRSLVEEYRKRRKAYQTGTTRPEQRWIYYDALTFLDLCEGDSGGGVSVSDEPSPSGLRCGGEHFLEEGNNKRNYFEETLYHSLDGITERAAAVGVGVREAVEPRLSNLPDALSSSDYCPPMKRSKGPGPTRAEYSSTVPGDPAGHSQYSIEIPSGSSQQRCSTLDVNGRRETDNFRRQPNPAPVGISDVNCPHYHFCMSLAARFRQMDTATATYVQMKIMEVFLKSEFPEEYKMRCRDNSS